MPKLQTACTTPVADGMVVHSHSDRAREGQDAVLEFLLLNHPLDCPVCDKGGECPLQDLTFRYGPGSTRMTLPKRTPTSRSPISPLIKLDRERCILCYRCTRFSRGRLRRPAAGDASTAARTRSSPPSRAGRTTASSPATSPSCAPSARSPPPPTGSAAGRGRSRTSRPSAASARSAATRTRPSARAGWRGCCRATTRPSTTAGCATAAATRSPACEPTERITTPLIRGGRGLEPADGADGARPHRRPAAGDASSGSAPARSAILASGDQTSEEAHLWARIQREALGGGPIVCGPRGRRRLGRAGALRGLDRRPGRRRPDRGRRSHRPRRTARRSWSCASVAPWSAARAS